MKLHCVGRKIIFMHFRLSCLTLTGLWCRWGQNDCVWYLKIDVGVGKATVFLLPLFWGQSSSFLHGCRQYFGGNIALFLWQTVQQKGKVLCQVQQVPQLCRGTGMHGKHQLQVWGAPSPYTRTSPVSYCPSRQSGSAAVWCDSLVLQEAGYFLFSRGKELSNMHHWD